MNRRHVILGMGSATATWPLAALAQQQSIPVIGFLSGRSPEESASAIGAFRQGLADVGYIEGKNVTIEYHWAQGKYDRLPAIAAELARSHVAVVAATGGSELAAKEATTSIPIVFRARP